MWLPLGAVNLLQIYIIPPLTINGGTDFTYPQGDGGLSCRHFVEASLIFKTMYAIFQYLGIVKDFFIYSSE